MSSTCMAVIDDDESICELVYEAFRDTYEVHSFRDGKAGLEGVAEHQPHVVILDLRLPEMGGLEVLENISERWPEIQVIMVTAHKDVQSAVKSMKLGAFDYIVKPFDLDEMDVLITKARENQELREEVRQLRSHLAGSMPHTTLIGESAPMQRVKEQIAKVAPTNVPVLIRGESGTGKEVAANAIHYEGPRCEEPFVPVNCTAIPQNLLESELFGHRKGAFTGADRDHKGKIELADQGTLFLDEIGAMPRDMQAKLLRVLQDHHVTPVGGEERIEVDFRLVSATSADLERLIRAKDFREDLFYRINVFSLPMPPLRDRLEDLPLLCEYFMERVSKKLNRPVEGLAESALELLRDHHWSGNVRELRNALESAAVMSETPRIQPEDFNL